MGKLVIVESPSKAKTIQKYLGKDYKVSASVGHIRDLAVGNATNSLGVDIENGFAPIYEISKGKARVVSLLKKQVAEADDVYLASDPDREGEAIAWHLASVLGLDIDKTKRLEFHEITYNAVNEALKNPRTIDLNLVASQETRRILDRIIGFKLSQLMKSKIGSISAGRVQSVVLKLICDRQKEIDNFVEKIFYKVSGTLLVDGNEVNVSLIDDKKEEIRFDSEEKANQAIEEIKLSKIYIDHLESNQKTRASKPVYITSTMQEDAANILYFDSSRTMKAAQKLYEGFEVNGKLSGLITYMRTDSVRVSPSFINKTKEKIKEVYGEDYVGVAKVFNKSKNNVQDAHEGIRPTDINITPDMIDASKYKDEAKLYELIYKRAIASMMKDEIFQKDEVYFKANEHILYASGETCIFDGFCKVNDSVKRIPLPCKISEDSEISYHELNGVEGKTKGPNAYNEASLIRAMKDYGIGRPSTYASTLSLIKAHDYVNVIKRLYVPTEQGKLTSEKLDESFKDIINVKYTADMETKLDEIAEGNETRNDALKGYYDKFIELYDIAKKEMAVVSLPKEDLGVCPNCGKALVKRKGPYGNFVACSGFPNCKYIQNDSKVGKPCPKCNDGKLMLRKGRYGKYYACDHCDFKESARKK